MVGEKHLRRETGRTLGITISNDVWSWIERQGDVARVLNGQEHVIKVIGNLRNAIDIFKIRFSLGRLARAALPAKAEPVVARIETDL